MLARAFARVAPLRRACVRLASTRLVGGPLSNLILPATSVATIDHLAPVDQAAQLMAERRVDALPVTKDNEVVGIFTERDYFDKVLNTGHHATRSTPVGDVAAMEPELVLARPDDTVEHCLELMTKKNLSAVAVVEANGQALGTLSIMDLTRQLLEAQASMVYFSEPPHFPENSVLPGGGIYDETDADDELFGQLMVEPESELTVAELELEELAAENFSEGSVFPEYTPPEEILISQALGQIPSEYTPLIDEKEEQLLAAQAELMGDLERFSEPSDFPEAATMDEVIQSRTMQ